MKLRKACITAILVVLLSGIWPLQVLATSSGATINIGLTVPQPPSGGGSGGGPTTPREEDKLDLPPSISSVMVSAQSTSASLTWSATDDKGIASVRFWYGTTPQTVVSNPVSQGYRTDVAGLEPASLYYYKIVVTDTLAHEAMYAGSFTTKSVETGPRITNIRFQSSETAVTVSWLVDKPSFNEVQYGRTKDYDKAIDKNVASAGDVAVTLTQLIPNTAYHFRVSATDIHQNTTTSIDYVVITKPDEVAPANPYAIRLVTTTSQIELSWINPTDEDFSRVEIVRIENGYARSTQDGTIVYRGSALKFTDSSVVSGVVYYYTLYALDTSANKSSGVGVDGEITVKQAHELCDNGRDDDANGAADCDDEVCKSYARCVRVVEDCSNGRDDDANGFVDCGDPVCTGATLCKTVGELCANGMDDDANGMVDCQDRACFGYQSCAFVDVNKEIQTAPTSTMPSFAALKPDSLEWFAGAQTIRLETQNNTVSALAGTVITAVLPNSKLAGKPETIALVVDGSGRNLMRYREEAKAYVTDIVVPRIGKHSVVLEVDYGGGDRDVVITAIESLPLGLVTSKNGPVDGAVVEVLRENNERVGSLESDQNGLVGFMVPNGTYALRISKKGYYDRTTPLMVIANNSINRDVELIALPPDLLDDVSATSTTAGNVVRVVKNVVSKTGAIARLGTQAVRDVLEDAERIKSDPVVQKGASTVVAPTIVTVTAVSTFTLISWTNALPLLRLLFLQPLLLLGLRRRKGWGQVYNTLNKMPVDLATLRLINAETGKVVQSKVTDREGRYAFVVNPGSYTIQVVKNGFSFPSALLAHAKSDGSKIDIYHGEIIQVTEQDAVITANIPLDPAGEHRRLMRLVWQRAFRFTQLALSWIGIFASTVTLWIAPKPHVWLLFAAHCILFVVFRRLALPPKIKSWGVVYDATTKKPVSRAVARLFNFEFNKLVATQVTDGAGRYYFLASDNKYYVTYDHPSYASEKTNTLDLTGKVADNIAVDVVLRPHDATMLPQTHQESASDTAPHS